MSYSVNRPPYRLEELAEATGVSPRTVRFYTAEGLLPPPDARGRFALYTEEHARRLRLIARLKEAFLPLDIIREKLRTLTDAEMDALLADPNAPEIAPQKAVKVAETSAAEYLDHVLTRKRLPSATTQSDFTPEPVAEEWKRIPLAPGVELHCRTITLFVQQLLAFARTLKPS